MAGYGARKSQCKHQVLQYAHLTRPTLLPLFSAHFFSQEALLLAREASLLPPEGIFLSLEASLLPPEGIFLSLEASLLPSAASKLHAVAPLLRRAATGQVLFSFEYTWEITAPKSHYSFKASSKQLDPREGRGPSVIAQARRARFLLARPHEARRGMHPAAEVNGNASRC
jgi:hypothetical protein